MVRATWYLCLVATAMVAAVAAAGRAQSHWPKKRPGHSVSARPKGREFLGLHRAPPFHPADVPRGGRSRVSRRAEAKARKGVEDDPVRRIIGNKKAARLAVSRAMEELDALEENSAEGMASHLVEETSHLTPEAAEEEKPQAPAAEAGQNSHVQEEQTGNRFAPSEARQTNNRFSYPQAAPGDRFTPEAVQGDRFIPQAPPADQLSSEAGKNRNNLEVNADRFTPPAGKGSQVGSKGNENNYLDPEGNRFTPEAGRNPFTPTKSKYAIPELGSKRFSPEAEDKKEFSPKPNGFALEGGNKNQLSTERNSFTPEESDRSFGPQTSTTNRFASQGETKNDLFSPKLAHQPKKMINQVMNDPGQVSVTPGEEASVAPGEESNVTPGEESSAAVSRGRASTVSAEPLWLAWYNTHPWRQEILSEYGEEARPSKTAFGL